MRHASNEFNSLAVANFATYYIIDAQGHQVYLYMRFGMPIDSTKRSVQEMLAAQLEATFAHVRRTRAELEKIEASDDNNLEENTAISERLNVLSHVAEMNYAPALAEGFETKEQKHTVGEVLSTFMPNEEPVTLLRMEGVLTGEGDCEPSTIEVLEAEEMKNFRCGILDDERDHIRNVEEQCIDAGDQRVDPRRRTERLFAARALRERNEL